ncbi:MAG: 50S ribosomal protein L5 [Thermoplasmatota archaeon]
MANPAAGGATVKARKPASNNPNRKPRLVKVVVNIGVGEAGDRLGKAERVMELVTGIKPARTLSRVANRDWNLRVGMPIGVRVTLRDEEAAAFLKKALETRANRMPDYSFDDGGNLNFGVADYTEFAGQKYDPEIGIFGMDIAVVLERAGGRVRRRRIRPARIPTDHRVSRAEAMQFMRDNFAVEVVS